MHLSPLSPRRAKEEREEEEISDKKIRFLPRVLQFYKCSSYPPRDNHVESTIMQIVCVCVCDKVRKRARTSERDREIENPGGKDYCAKLLYFSPILIGFFKASEKGTYQIS